MSLADRLQLTQEHRTSAHRLGCLPPTRRPRPSARSGAILRSLLADADDRPVEGLAPHRALEDGTSEGEEPAVRGHLVVAPGRGDGDAHDGLVERLAAHRALEEGVTEGEVSAVGRDFEVAPAVRGGRHAHDRPVEMLAPHRAVEVSVAEGEEPAVGGDLVVARTRYGGCLLYTSPSPRDRTRSRMPS